MPTTVVSWNVNGLRSALRNGFLDWLERAQPDVLCLQESRVLPDQITDAERSPRGYTSFWMPAQKKGYSGVGVYTKLAPLSVSPMGKAEFDDEGRAQLIEFKDFTIVNGYWPNSQPERRAARFPFNQTPTQFILPVQPNTSPLSNPSENTKAGSRKETTT